MDTPVVVEGLVIRPGDKVLIAVPKEITLDQAQGLADDLREKFPGVDFGVLVGATGMAVQRAQD